jgi:hypothetical protein
MCINMEYYLYTCIIKYNTLLWQSKQQPLQTN